jgi:hypothetical protein
MFESGGFPGSGDEGKHVAKRRDNCMLSVNELRAQDRRDSGNGLGLGSSVGRARPW